MELKLYIRGMNFNHELYLRYRKAHHKDGVTTFPNGKYCFALNCWLGENGKIDNHPLLNKKVKKIENGVVYVIDSVCVHWIEMGYYYFATLRDENNSHATASIENINCNNPIILEGISKFKSKYEIIN